MQFQQGVILGASEVSLLQITDQLESMDVDKIAHPSGILGRGNLRQLSQKRGVGLDL